MGHPKIAQTPGQRGDNAQRTVGRRLTRCHVVSPGQVQITGQSAGILHDYIPAARLLDAEKDDDHQGDGHDDALDQVCRRYRQKPAQDRVADDDHGAHDHGHMVIHPKEAVEEGAHRLKAGGRIGDEENQNDHRRNAREHMAVVPVAAGEKVGNGDGPGADRIAAQPFGHDQPVEIGADRQSDGGPPGFRDAAEISQPRQTHEQPTAHIRRFCAHGRNDGSQLPAAQIELVR